MDKPEDLLHEGSSSHQSHRQGLTPTQAKKLDYLGLSFAELTHLHQHSSTMEVFLATLKAKGIRSKVLGRSWARRSVLHASRLLSGRPPPFLCWSSQQEQFIFLFTNKPTLFRATAFHRRFHLPVPGFTRCIKNAV